MSWGIAATRKRRAELSMNVCVAPVEGLALLKGQMHLILSNAKKMTACSRTKTTFLYRVMNSAPNAVPCEVWYIL